MSRLARVFQNLFASSPGPNQVGQFGSKAVGSPAFTTDPATIQALSQFETGWFGAVLSGASPAIEDMNALFLLAFYQMAYMFQSGIPEYDSTTTYYIGSLAQDGTGNIYCSRTDSNVGNALTSTTNWRLVCGNVMSALGDVTYGGSIGALTRLAGNTTTTRKFFRQVGDGVNSAAPAWDLFTGADMLGQGGLNVFTSGGTFTTPSNSTTSTIYGYLIIGAGGGGGGANGTVAAAGGGGSGAVARGTFTGVAPSTGITISVGTGGNGGSTSGGTGSTGGSSSIGSPVSITCSGGTGGGGSTASGGTATDGGSGGTVTGSPAFSLAGNPGYRGYSITNLSLGGIGAQSLYGGGGLGAGPTRGTGGVGSGYGAGGGGAVALTAGGGNGANGIVIIWQLTP